MNHLGDGFTATLMNELTIVLGLNSSRKSTLVNLLAGQQVPDSGCVE